METQLSDIGSERAVLAGLMQYGLDAYVTVSDIVTEDTFTHLNNQILFKCVEKIVINDQKVDIPSILSVAQQLNLYENINTDQEIKYIKSLLQFPVHKDNVFHFAIQIKKFEFARKIKLLISKISKDVDEVNGTESIDEIVKLLENPVTDFLREDDSGDVPEKLSKNIREYIEFVESNPCDIIGIPSGYSRYDEAIGGGLRRQCVDLVSARPKVGKSIFTDNVALNVTKMGIPVLVIDTEMSEKDHFNRLIANISGVEVNEVAKGRYVSDDEKRTSVHDAVTLIESIPYHYISVAGKPFEQILNLIKRWVMKEVGSDENGRTNNCLIIFDYLKLMSASSITNNIQEYQALGFQITALHNLCVKLDIPCLAFVQLNRDGITKESTDAVSGSDRLIWLCTSFTIFKTKSPEELAEDGPNAGNRKLVPIVARHGGGLEDGDYINMVMQGSHARLREIKTRNELKKQPISDTGLVDQNALDKIKINGLIQDQKPIE